MMLDLAIIAVIAGLSGLVAATIMTVLAERREARRHWRFAHRDHSGWDKDGQPWPYYKGNGEDPAEQRDWDTWFNEDAKVRELLEGRAPTAEQRDWDTWFNEGGQAGAWYGPNDPRNS